MGTTKTAATAASAACIDGVRRTLMPEGEEKETEEFLLWTRVLLRHMDGCSDARMHAAARAQVGECHARKAVGDPRFRSLIPALKARLRATVGEGYWKMTNDHVSHVLSGGEGATEKTVHPVSPVRVHSRQNKATDPLWLRQRLLLLRHAARCPHRDCRCPVTPHCAVMKRLLNHLSECQDPRCPVPHCISFRQAHQPVRMAIQAGAEVGAAGGRRRAPQSPAPTEVIAKPSSTTTETRSPHAEPSGVRAFLKRKKQKQQQGGPLGVPRSNIPNENPAAPANTNIRPCSHWRHPCLAMPAGSKVVTTNKEMLLAAESPAMGGHATGTTVWNLLLLAQAASKKGPVTYLGENGVRELGDQRQGLLLPLDTAKGPWQDRRCPVIPDRVGTKRPCKHVAE